MVMRGFKKSMWLLTVVMLMGLWAVSPALAGDPPSLDMHQEQTFVVDQLFERQKVEREAQKRVQLVHDMQKRIMDQAWEIAGLWWTRVEVRSARLHNYEPLPSHWMNRRLEDVWLSTK